MLDQKYEKDDMVIVQDPYMRVEYKECGTSTDKLSSKAEASSSEQEGPTRDHNEEVMNLIINVQITEIHNFLDNIIYFSNERLLSKINIFLSDLLFRHCKIKQALQDKTD